MALIAMRMIAHLCRDVCRCLTYSPGGHDELRAILIRARNEQDVMCVIVLRRAALVGPGRRANRRRPPPRWARVEGVRNCVGSGCLRRTPQALSTEAVCPVRRRP